MKINYLRSSLFWNSAWCGLVVDNDVSGQYIFPIRKSKAVPVVIRGKLRPQSHCGGNLQYLIFNVKKIQCVSVEIYKSLGEGAVFFRRGGGAFYVATCNVKGIRNRFLRFMKLEPNVTVNQNFWPVFWMSWFLICPEGRPSWWQLWHGSLSPSRHVSVNCSQTSTTASFHTLSYSLFADWSTSRCCIINQLFTSAQHLLLLVIGLHVSTDHSVIFRSLICYTFQGAVHTFGIPIVFTFKTIPFTSVGVKINCRFINPLR